MSEKRRLHEDHKERRGEPVKINVHGREILGTIEWGDDQRGYSVATEPSGARHQVQASGMIADPGSSALCGKVGLGIKK